MKTNKNLVFYFFAFIIFGLTLSCDDFLDEVPDNRTEIDNAEKIELLLVNAYPQASYFWVAESMSDNVTDIGLSGTTDYDINTFKYFWNDVIGIGSDTPTSYWNGCYRAIAYANQALESIEELELSGSNEDFRPLRGEALVARAYAHFMLVTLWGKSYNPATSDGNLGVPIVTEPEKVVIKEYTRASVEEVYAQIERDLLEGLPLLRNKYKEPKFHFTKQAAYIFASRFYQFKGEWDNVNHYASLALGSGPSSLIRDLEYYRTLPGFRDMAKAFQSSTEPANALIVGASSLYARRYPFGRYGISEELSREIFTNKRVFGKAWSYYRLSYGPRFFIPKYSEYFKLTSLTSDIGFVYTMTVLLTYDEAILNRAEAHVMQNNFDAALIDLNIFLSKKVRGYDSATDQLTYEYVATTYGNTSQDEFAPFYDITDEQRAFIKFILDCRQREFVFQGMRWLDNKRMNMIIDHKDFDGNSFILTREDPRRELEIPETAISFGLESNPR